MRCRSSRAFAFLSADLGQTVVPTPSIPYGSPSLEGFLSEKPWVTPELHQVWPQNKRKQRKRSSLYWLHWTQVTCSLSTTHLRQNCCDHLFRSYLTWSRYLTSYSSLNPHKSLAECRARGIFGTTGSDLTAEQNRSQTLHSHLGLCQSVRGCMGLERRKWQSALHVL